MKEFYLNINTLKLCIQQYGESSKPPLLILHGWLDHSGSWEAVARRLSDKHCVFILDQRGHGKSDFAPPSTHYHFPDYVADVQTLVQTLNLSDFNLIGHSMGGTVASLYSAFAHPKPKQLILIEGLGPPHETDSIATQRYQQHLSQRREESSHKTMPSLEAAATKLQRTHPYLHKSLSLKLADRLTIQRPDGFQWRWDPRHKHRSAVGFHLPRHLRMLSSITSPTTLIFGEQSWYIQMSDLEERIESLSAPINRHILNTGHSPHLEQPILLGELLLEVLCST